MSTSCRHHTSTPCCSRCAPAAPSALACTVLAMQAVAAASSAAPSATARALSHPAVADSYAHRCTLPLLPLLLQLVAHVSANKVILRRWEEGSVREYSAISYPNAVRMPCVGYAVHVLCLVCWAWCAVPVLYPARQAGRRADLLCEQQVRSSAVRLAGPVPHQIDALSGCSPELILSFLSPAPAPPPIPCSCWTTSPRSLKR